VFAVEFLFTMFMAIADAPLYRLIILSNR